MPLLLCCPGLLDFGFRTATPLWTATHRTLNSRCHETLGRRNETLGRLGRRFNARNPLTSLRFLRFWMPFELLYARALDFGFSGRTNDNLTILPGSLVSLAS